MRTLLSILLLCLVQQASGQCTPVITPAGNTTFCDGNDVTLNASLGDTYQWYLDGNLISGAQSNSYVAAVAGSYTVEVDSVGCVNMSPAVVVTVNTVPAQPGAIAISDDTICQGSQVTFSVMPVQGATSYQWYIQCNMGVLQNTAIPSLTTQVNASLNNSTPYTPVIVRAENSCGFSTMTMDSLAIYSPVYTQGMNTDHDITWASTEAYICPNDPNNELNAFSHPPFWGYYGTPQFQWYRNNVLIPGATGYSYYIHKGGSYKVVINTGNVCYETIQKVPIYEIVPTVDSIEILTPQPMCEGGATLLKVNFNLGDFNGTDFLWWWIRDNTIIPSPSPNTNYIVVTEPGNYKIGLYGEGYGGQWINCPTTPVLATVTMSTTQATPVTVTQNGMTLSATPGFVAYQWYKNTTPINGATGESYTMTTWGDYFVLATDANGCVSQSNITLGANNIIAEGIKLQASPNPTTGIFAVSALLLSSDKTATLELIDVSGKVIVRKEIAVSNNELNEQIQMDTHATGVYFLKLTSGSFSKVISIVKQ